MKKKNDEDKVKMSDVEKAEKLLRERDEKNFTEYVTRLKALRTEFGYEPYVPEIQQPRLQIRRVINA